MEKFWIFILVLFFTTNSLEKAESVQLFDEIFGEGWWDNEKDEEWNKLTLKHNLHHQIDRQNTQIGQIEPNLTDQKPPLTESDHYGQIEPTSTDQLGQIEPNSTDQNPPLTESDHFGQIEPNSTDQNPPLTESEIASNDNNAEDEQKRKIIDKFHEMKDEFKGKGNYSAREWNQIDKKIAKHFKVSRTKIYKWKKEFGLTQKKTKNERQSLIEKFDQRKAELTQAGLKNSYPSQIDETVAKELGLHFKTIYNWKRKLGQSTPNHKYPHSEQKELMKLYYEIKDQTPKINDKDIAKMLKIGTDTLVRWKRLFKRQHFQPNAVDVGHSVEENAAENVQEIENSNYRTI